MVSIKREIVAKEASIYEICIESTLYACRWLLLPLFFGLAFLVVLLTIEFYTVLIDTTFNIMSITKKELIVVVLTLVDMALIGSLIVMVAISGYENFVSRISLMNDQGDNKPTIFSRLDPGTIKIKLGMVVIAISSIQLLQTITDISGYEKEEIAMQVLLHLSLIAAGVGMAHINKSTPKKRTPLDNI
jgi:uncharacterized protein (TIGR00645 family)